MHHARGVCGDKAQRRFQRNAFASDQIDQFAMQHMAGAVGQADAVSLRIKARLAAESVAGERHAADVCAFRKRLHHLPCRAAGRGFAGGKIRLPAGFDPAHRFFQKISVDDKGVLPV